MSRHQELESQRMQDAAYRRAWAELTPAEISAMAQPRFDRDGDLIRGIKGPDCGDHKTPDQHGREVVGHQDDAATMADFRSDLCAETDMATSADGLPDLLAERFDLTPGQAEGVAEFIATAIRRSTMQTQSLQLQRIVGFFLLGAENLQARAHGLAHAARMARLNGITSMRDSARKCGVSVEWITRVAWRWVKLLDLPPLEGAKSPEACKAYSQDKRTNHWRTRKCKPTAQNGTPPAEPTPPTQKQITSALPLNGNAKAA